MTWLRRSVLSDPRSSKAVGLVVDETTVTAAVVIGLIVLATTTEVAQWEEDEVDLSVVGEDSAVGATPIHACASKSKSKR